MVMIFFKPLDQLDQEDIRELEREGTPEGQLFEIKGSVPGKDGPDPWHEPVKEGRSRSGPRAYAKREIFKELSAFANTDGGWCVIGLEETSSSPKRVKKYRPVPDCHELAARLEAAARSWFDPPVPSLRCRGVEMGDSAEGVVVCRVPPSPEAPHRLNVEITQRAFRRDGDESRPMSMREIQDLTIEKARGMARVDQAFAAQQENYLLVRIPESEDLKEIGFRITLVPLSRPLAIDRPYAHEDLFRRQPSVMGSFAGGGSLGLRAIDRDSLGRTTSPPQPILRGGQRLWQWHFLKQFEHHEKRYHEIALVEVLGNGTVDIIVKSNRAPPGLSMHWILTEAANAFRIVERTRLLGGNPDAEYVMEIELRFDARVTGRFPGEFHLGLLSQEDNFTGVLGPYPLLLPRYLVGPRETFPVLLKAVMNDLNNAVRREHEDDFEFDPIED